MGLVFDLAFYGLLIFRAKSSGGVTGTIPTIIGQMTGLTLLYVSLSYVFLALLASSLSCSH